MSFGSMPTRAAPTSTTRPRCSSRSAGKKLDAFVYIMHEERELGIPSSIYVRTCVAGYRHFGFDLKHLRLAMDISERGEIV